MSFLSLPCELLCIIIESEILDDNDVKNLRLTHRILRDYAQGRLFSDLSFNFSPPVPKEFVSKKEMKRRLALAGGPSTADQKPNAPLSNCQKVRKFLAAEQKHVPQTIRYLRISVDGEKDDGFSTFVSSLAKKFLRHFNSMQRLRLDFSEAFQKQNNQDGNMVALLKTLSTCQEAGLSVGVFELAANWKWLANVGNIAAAGVTSITMLTHSLDGKLERASETKMSELQDLLRTAEGSIVHVLKKCVQLENLDLTRADKHISLRKVLEKSSEIDKGPAGATLTSLCLRGSQLPQAYTANMDRLLQLKVLKIVDLTPDGRRDPKPTNQAKMWEWCARAGIQVKEIHTTALSNALLNFLDNNKSVTSIFLHGEYASVENKPFSFVQQANFLKRQISPANQASIPDHLINMTLHLRDVTLPLIAGNITHLAFHVHLVRSRSRPHLVIDIQCHAVITISETNNIPRAERPQAFGYFMNVIKSCNKLRVLELSGAGGANEEGRDNILRRWRVKQPSGVERLWKCPEVSIRLKDHRTKFDGERSFQAAVVSEFGLELLNRYWRVVCRTDEVEKTESIAFKE